MKTKPTRQDILTKLIPIKGRVCCINKFTTSDAGDCVLQIEFEIHDEILTNGAYIKYTYEVLFMSVEELKSYLKQYTTLELNTLMTCYFRINSETKLLEIEDIGACV